MNFYNYSLNTNNMVTSAAYLLPGLTNPNLNEQEIIHAVCKVCGKNPFELQETRNCRKPEYVFPRQLIVTLIHKAMGKSLARSGVVYSFHHSTTLHSVKTIKNWYQTNKNKRNLILNVLSLLSLRADFVERM